MSLHLTGIDHVEVFVSDMAASARWYAEVLGLREMYRWDPEPLMIGVGESKLALFQADANARPCLSDDESRDLLRWHRVAWQTDAGGFAAAQEHLRSLGISFDGPYDHGRAKSIYFFDPDGHPLEITHYLAGN